MKKWFRSLKVPQKLALVCTFFVLPNVLMLYFFVTGLNANIRFAQLEQKGIEFQRPLEDLLQLIPKHGRLAEPVSRQAPTNPELAEIETQIEAALAALTAVDARLGVELQFTDEGLAKRKREHCRPATLRAEWRELRARLGEFTPEERARRHEHLLADVRTMITHVGDMSGLILDPDLDSYYLMDATLLALPQAKLRLARVIACGRAALGSPEAFQRERQALAIHATLLREADLERITGSVQTALNEDANFFGTSASLQSNLPPALHAYTDSTEAFIQLTARVAASEKSEVTAEEFLASGLAARAASVQLWTVAVRELHGLLQGRISYYQHRRAMSLLATGCALVATIFFVTFITRSITGPLHEQARALATANDGLLSEVAERARMEQSFRESEARFRSVVDTALDAVVTMDAAGKIIGWNFQAETIFGWKAEEAIGQSLSQTIVPPQHREAHERGLKRFLASGLGPVLNKRIEITAMHRDGREIEVELAITPLKMEGKIEFSAFLRDISARKQGEEERQRLVNFLEASFNEVYVFDPSSLRFSYVNQSALKNLGYTTGQIYQRTPLDLKPEFTEAAFRAMVAPLLDGTTARHVFQTIHRRADGTDYPVEICLQVVSTTAENVFLAVANDISERKRTEADLSQAQKELLASTRQAGMAEIATGVLHNVGNVLNSVNVSANLVSDQVRKTPVADLGRLVALLREQGANLGAFFTSDPRGLKVTHFLAELADKFTRQQENQLKEVASLQKNVEHIKDIVAMQQSYATVSGLTESLSPVELIEDALRMNAGSFQKHELELVRELPADLPQVCVDKHKVLQILINLLRNAKHACDDSGRADKRITVRATSEGGRVRITVTDTGVGIPAENLNRIFNHGFTTKKTGHGFGLHSAANAAKEMGGSLTVHSDGPGHGAAFTLELPVKPSRGPGRATPDQTNGRCELNSATQDSKPILEA